MATTPTKRPQKPPAGKKAPAKGKASSPQKGGVVGALTRKLGPLPAWAWLGLLAVGVWYYRKTHASSSTSSTSPASSGGGIFGGGGSGSGGGDDSGGGGGSPTPPTDTSTGSDTGTTTTAVAPLRGVTATTGASATPNAASSAQANAPAAIRAMTPTQLQSIVATPNSNGIYAASPYAPFAPGGSSVGQKTKPGGGYSASTTQGVFAVEGGQPLAPTTAKTSSAVAANQKKLAATKPLKGGSGKTTALKAHSLKRPS